MKGPIYMAKVLSGRQLSSHEMDLCRSGRDPVQLPHFERFYSLNNCAFCIETKRHADGKVSTDVREYNSAGQLSRWSIDGVEYCYMPSGSFRGKRVN